MRLQHELKLLTTTAIIVGSMIGAPAFAQDAESAGGLEEIVVTAQKREQSVQDVPTSVSAITAEDLEINRIQSVADLDSVTPGLTITTIPAGNSSPVYSMRGVIGLGTAPGADRGVALYVDGVYIGGPGANSDIADIERVEVLKGPQGTLFGRNSTGGAVSITTRGPRGELHLKQKLSYGNYDQFQSSTRIDTPQFGPFSAALTYLHSERRGEMKNLGGATVWDGSANGLSSRLHAADWLGSENSEAIAASLRAEVTPDFDLVYKYDYSKGRFTEQGVGQIAPHPIPSVAAMNVGSGSPLFVSKTRPDAVNNWATVPSKVRALGHVLTATWQASDAIRIKNVLAYRESSYFGPLNDLFGTGGLFAGPNLPFFTVVTLSAGEDSQWSNEFQVDYDSDLFRVTAGGLYYDQSNKKGQAGTGFNAINFTVAPGFKLPAPANSPVEQSEVDVTSWAVYAQGEVGVTEGLDLVAGARYTDDKKRGIDRTTPLGGDLNYDGNRWTYNLGVNYKPNSDVLVYAKYATGYISGGKLATLTYAPETAKSWEAGVKADWLNNRLRTNLAVYSVDYKNLQVAASGLSFGVPQASQVLINAGNARARGFELEVTAVPVDSITLGANIGYMDFKYTRLDPRFEAAGQSVPSQRPKWTAQLSAEYKSQPVIGEAYLTLRADANYRSAHPGTAYNAATFQTNGRLPESWVINSALSLEDLSVGGAEVRLTAWVKNLFDEDGARYVLVQPFSSAAVYERARTYGVDLTIEF